MLTVIDEASSYDLASVATVKAALGVTGTDEDASLSALISRASAAIATYCNRVFAEETIEETVRDAGCGIMLSRYPVSITTVTEAGTILGPTDYEVDAAAGIISRFRSDRPTRWACGRTVVRYDSGYTLAAMPADIVQGLVMTVAAFRSQASRDPMLRAEETTDVERLEWEVGGTEGLPAAAMALLDPHRAPARF